MAAILVVAGVGMLVPTAFAPVSIVSVLNNKIEGRGKLSPVQ